MAKSRQTSLSPFLVEYSDFIERFAVSLPRLYRAINDDDYLFTGITVFLGDNNAVVVGIKRQSNTGKKMILWSSGSDFFHAMMNTEKAIEKEAWKEDKRPDPKKM